MEKNSSVYWVGPNPPEKGKGWLYDLARFIERRADGATLRIESYQANDDLHVTLVVYIESDNVDKYFVYWCVCSSFLKAMASISDVSKIGIFANIVPYGGNREGEDNLEVLLDEKE